MRLLCRLFDHRWEDVALRYDPHALPAIPKPGETSKAVFGTSRQVCARCGEIREVSVRILT